MPKPPEELLTDHVKNALGTLTLQNLQLQAENEALRARVAELISSPSPKVES